MSHEEPQHYSTATGPYRDAEVLSSAELDHEPRGRYGDVFKGLDKQQVLSRPLMHPGTGQPLTPTSPFEGQCPTFRPPRSRTPQRSPSPRSATLPIPVSTMPPSPLSPANYSYPTYTSTSHDGSIYAPSRSSSTKSSITSVTPPTSTTASRSSSGASRRSKPRPGPCPLPAQPGVHNSLAEFQARQVNIVRVQQPISPYAEVSNPLEKARYVVTGMVRKKSSGIDLRGRDDDEGGERKLGKKSSFARLGDLWGAGSAYESGGNRRGSPMEMDISKNF